MLTMTSSKPKDLYPVCQVQRIHYFVHCRNLTLQKYFCRYSFKIILISGDNLGSYIGTGGFGSGVRIDFKKSYTFELICLYTNSERVRECQQGLNRLLASNNRLLVSDVTPEVILPEKFLHENVHKLLPTLDALFFAIDNTVEEDNDFISQVGGQLDHLQIRQIKSKWQFFLFLSCFIGIGIWIFTCFKMRQGMPVH